MCGWWAWFCSCRGKRDYLDVEFQGGVAEIDVKQNPDDPLDDRVIRARLVQVGEIIRDDASKLAEATVEPVSGTPNLFRLQRPVFRTIAWRHW